jgi:hypothetical protein
VLDEEFARIFGENFTGESCRTVTSGNTNYNLHYRSSLPAKTRSSDKPVIIDYVKGRRADCQQTRPGKLK